MSIQNNKPAILIVDDIPENLFVLEKLLKKLDVNIVKAGSGNEALSSILYNEFALIILDVQMPEMDGFEVAEILKSEDETANIPIIFVTAIDRDDAKEVIGYERGAVDFIFKPYNEYILLSKVIVFLELYKMKTGLEVLVGERTNELRETNERLLKEIIKNKQVEEELRKYRDQLEEQVAERTRELESKASELEEANLSLQEADRLKSVFLASMSHELRTPLNSIIGFTGIMLQGISGEINDEQKKQLTMVKKGGDHLLSLINDLLDIAKIEAERVELAVEEFDLDDIVKEVVETFSPVVMEKGLELTKYVPEGITLISDRRRVKQVLMNLLSNAVKFTDDGSIRVAAGISEGEKVEMNITDTGIGIKAEDMKILFQPFQQVDTSLTKRHEGSGLGLHLTKKLAALLRSEVSAKSEFGKGSEFTFTIPLKI